MAFPLIVARSRICSAFMRLVVGTVLFFALPQKIVKGKKIFCIADGLELGCGNRYFALQRRAI